jgi:hypothetical protein
VNRRRFLARLAVTLAGAAGLAVSPWRPKPKPSLPLPTTSTALPATTATTTTTTVVSRTSAPPPSAATDRPMPGAEPFPAANYPPRTTDTLLGTQTTQYRPHVSDRILDLTGAVWDNAPSGGLLYPIVVDDAGAGTPDGTRTILKNARVNGTLDLSGIRGTQYANYSSGIEQNSNTAAGWIITDGVRVSKMMDAYRLRGDGTGYIKRLYASDIADDAFEIEELNGDVYIYDTLIDGCCVGISDRDGAALRSDNKLEIDGLLMWIKPWTDVKNSSGTFQGCSGTGPGSGCEELAISGKFGFTPWKGHEDSRSTVIVRNSWFRIDRMSCYGTSSMAWPGAGLTWGRGTPAPVYKNVKVLWTGLDLSGNPTDTPYPGPALPKGVELVSGPAALAMWDRAAVAWKTAHGY